MRGEPLVMPDSSSHTPSLSPSLPTTGKQYRINSAGSSALLGGLFLFLCPGGHSRVAGPEL